MRSVFDDWADFERKVVPSSAGAIQREECRLAFYAGAWALYWLVLEATADPNEVQCERNLKALHDEIQSVTLDLALKGRD